MLEIIETRQQDIDLVKKLWADGEVMKYVGFPNGLHQTRESMEKWYQWICSSRPLTNHFCVFDNKQYCGETFYSIDKLHSTASLDIKLYKFARGKGLAYQSLFYAIEQAFDNGAKTVWVDPNPFNTKAIALYKKLGFKENAMPGYLVKEDEVNSIYMELSRPLNETSI